MNAIDRIFEILRSGGRAEYGNDRVSQLDHALQCATLAEQQDASTALVTAALLHDIGHLLADDELAAFERGDDTRHEIRGADWLAQWFGDDVTEPVRGHVAAKRYLTATDQGYFDILSPVSRRTLELQGGPFTAAEAAAFASRPFAEQAAAVRRWDDSAKVFGADVAMLEHFREALAASLGPASSDAC